jgi:hypothetical protein
MNNHSKFDNERSIPEYLRFIQQRVSKGDSADGIKNDVLLDCIIDSVAETVTSYYTNILDRERAAVREIRTKAIARMEKLEAARIAVDRMVDIISKDGKPELKEQTAKLTEALSESAIRRKKDLDETVDKAEAMLFIPPTMIFFKADPNETDPSLALMMMGVRTDVPKHEIAGAVPMCKARGATVCVSIFEANAIHMDKDELGEEEFNRLSLAFDKAIKEKPEDVSINYVAGMIGVPIRDVIMLQITRLGLTDGIVMIPIDKSGDVTVFGKVERHGFGDGGTMSGGLVPKQDAASYGDTL